MSKENIPNLVNHYMHPIQDKDNLYPIYQLFSTLKILNFKDLLEYVVLTPRCNLFNNILSKSQLERLLCNIKKQIKKSEDISSILIYSLQTGDKIWFLSKRFKSFQLLTINIIVKILDKTYINCFIKNGNRMLTVNININNPNLLPNVDKQHILSDYIEAKKSIINYLYQNNICKKQYDNVRNFFLF